MKIGDYGGDFIIDRLNSHDYEAYYVGGCVRDSLLEIPVSDYDLTTNCIPEKIIEIFQDKKIFTVGIKHGTISVLIDDKVYEITTFRHDGDYLDNRHPKKVEFCCDLKSDLLRRDFTVNAFAFNKNQGLIDYFNGFYDLQNKVLKAVGNPEVRFKEDALRILRALRFASKLGFNIENKTKEALLTNYNLLSNVSSERIFSELKGIFLGFNAKKILIEYKDVLCYILPQLNELSQIDYEWSVLALSSCKSLVVKFCTLFYHLNKSQILNLLKQLKCDNATLNAVLSLHECKDGSVSNQFEIKLLMNKLNGDLTNFFEFKKAIFIANGNYKDCEVIDNAEKTYGEILKNGDCYSLKQLALNGNDIANYCKENEIGKLLNSLLNEVIFERVKNDKDSLLKHLLKLL